MDHELEILEQYIQDARGKFANRSRLRECNIQDNINYPDQSTLDNLDSSIKKNSAFVKRLKGFTESQKDQILNEIDRLNLTKFISEVAASIIEAKLKLSDIPAIIEICSKLNRCYRDFSGQLLDQYVKYFPPVQKKRNCDVTSAAQGTSTGSQGSSSHSGAKNQPKNVSESVNLNPSKIRVDLRLFGELITSGIFPLKDSFPVLMNLLCFLMIHDKNSYHNATAILTFCKGCGDEVANLVPSKILALSEAHQKTLPKSDLISGKRQDMLKSHLCEYYQSLVKYFQSLHTELHDMMSRTKRGYKAKGEVSRDMKELIEIKFAECQKVQNVLQQLADLLGESTPELPDLDSLREAAITVEPNLDNLPRSGLVDQSLSIWDDEGTRSFYEDLADLRTLFPNLAVKHCKIKKDEQNEIEHPDKKLDQQAVNSQLANDDQDQSVNGNFNESLQRLDTTTLSSSSSEESLHASNTPSPQSGPLETNPTVANRTQPDHYFSKLSNCVNRDMIDNAAIDFICFFNTKFGRKKLVKTLFNVQRTRLDLLPFFARLAATLNPFVPSIGAELFSLLRQTFKNLFLKKDQINIESKVKNARFIGELVKFNLYSKHEALACLRMLLSDFTHHHIEMACNLLETCGRVLYKSAESHHQLKALLEQMMRKKLLLSVDSKYITMIENAYYFTNPPEIVKHVVEEPPVHTYVRYLLYECLNRSTIESVLKKIKKLDWNDRQLTKFVISCMIEAYNLKFYNIRYLAALLAALNKEYQWLSTAVIDGVVEDILLMMEVNEIQFNQRRIPMTRYFGELYNYRLSDSSLVFKILYSLITYGVYYPEPKQTLSQIPLSQLDLPDNLFRIKLVCDLLETCGQYLSSGQEKKKLDCYLLFFQRYYWCKRHIYMLHPYCLAKSGNQFPAAIEYLYNDAIYNLRPNFQMAGSYGEAIGLVQNFIDNLTLEQACGGAGSEAMGAGGRDSVGGEAGGSVG